MSQPTPRHFIDLWKLEAGDLRAILEDAKARKAARFGWPKGQADADAPAAGRTLAMIFEKNSTRTRFSFDAAMRQLGGDVIISNAHEMQLGRGEPIEDTARVLSRMVDGVMIRANVHEDVERLALASSVPVINGLSDKGHPCQIMADILTIEEHRGRIAGKTLAWVGDGNNVLTSLVHAAAGLGFAVNVASPPELAPAPELLAWARERQARVRLTHDPREAVSGADAVFADVWASMGQQDVERRRQLLEPYRVDAPLFDLAKPEAIFLHCLPAHRGEEVTGEVIDGPRSAVFDEAENRLHAQKAILEWCLGRG
jgi:ornithine carbamoyltransferase